MAESPVSLMKEAISTRNLKNSPIAGGMKRYKKAAIPTSINNNEMTIHSMRLRNLSLYWKNFTIG